HADGVLGPADGIDECAGAVPPGVLREQFADLPEGVDRYAADVGDHLRRVARVVPFEHLEHAPRVLQRRVDLRDAGDPNPTRAVRLPSPRLAHSAAAGFSVLAAGLVLIFLVAVTRRGLDLHALVLPGVEVVGALVDVEPGEHPLQVLGVAVV